MLLRLDVYTESLLLSGANLALAKRSLGLSGHLRAASFSEGSYWAPAWRPPHLY